MRSAAEPRGKATATDGDWVAAAPSHAGLHHRPAPPRGAGGSWLLIVAGACEEGGGGRAHVPDRRGHGGATSPARRKVCKMPPSLVRDYAIRFFTFFRNAPMYFQIDPIAIANRDPIFFKVPPGIFIYHLIWIARDPMFCKMDPGICR
ncbi:hypothetical protein GQ55_8G245400 [Panicum hallii var. hallii]|uniref:Uncharacterized protein n=1 Tax=Panicum hallii var. hallii TaxID=1504633 RepID=A0A2T7CQT5_9POAL|nr:hypothetical protein GQ55_8G245400 [Panicum hallii var. hallii]